MEESRNWEGTPFADVDWLELTMSLEGDLRERLYGTIGETETGRQMAALAQIECYEIYDPDNGIYPPDVEQGAFNTEVLEPLNEQLRARLIGQYGVSDYAAANTYVGGVAVPVYGWQRVNGCSAVCDNGQTVSVPCGWC